MAIDINIRQPGAALHPPAGEEIAVPRRELGLQAWLALRTGLPLLACDLVVATLTFLLMTALSPPFDGGIATVGPAVAVALVGAALIVVGAYPGVGLSPWDEARKVFLACFGLAALQVGRAASAPAFHLADLLATVSWAIVLASVIISVRRLARTRLSRRAWWGERALVVGSNASAHRLADALRAYRHQGLIPIELPRCYRQLCETMPEYRRLVQSARWIVRLGDREDAPLPRAWTGTRIFAAATDSFSLSRRPFPAVAVPGRRSTRYRMSLLPCTCKRGLDLLIAVTSMLLMTPVYVGLIVAVKCTSPGPVFFGHWRVGRNGRMFRTWKFRTMVADGAAALRRHLDSDPAAREEWARTHKLVRDPRVTRIGGFLRRWSLDELPQMWNVLNGTMSLVGPRPIVPDEIPKYGPWFTDYAAVRPGITGLWQVSIRTDTTYDERVQLDAYYVQHWTPWLDLLILARTATAVVRGEGAV
jgi:exopolysaccharide biosynthesis polyprenyl glycosylphosphotransferase